MESERVHVPSLKGYSMIESVYVEKCEVSSKQDDVKPKTVEFVMAAEPLQSFQIIAGPQSPECTVTEKKSLALEMTMWSFVQSVFVFSNKPCKKDDLEKNPTQCLPKVHRTPEGELVKTDSSVALITFDSPVKRTESSTQLGGCTTVKSVFLEGCDPLIEDNDARTKVAQCTTETVEINSVKSTAPTKAAYAQICQLGSLEQKEGLARKPQCPTVASAILTDIQIH